MFEIYNDVLTDDLHEKCAVGLLKSSKWKFGNMSSPYSYKIDDRYSSTCFPFWQIMATEDPRFSVDFLKVIQMCTGENYNVLRVMINGQTYGQSGNFHTDVERPGDIYSFVYFAHKEWKPDWGGHLILDLGDGRYESILPFPNTAVLFKSTIPHVGMEPSRHCSHLRMSIAFLLEKQK